jgi:type I restriction-modification system DNA methylase subunit
MSEIEIAFKRIGALVKEFQSNESHYKSAKYSEAEARKDFIDKFWIALGWDVNHDQQTNPYEQEVKVERGVAMGGNQRRADYAFYLAPNFHDVRFFVEAKKPFVEIGTKENYFQLMRYGWNSETPLAVLTDFEEFHILDCRYKPDIETALNRAIVKYHCTDYTKREKFEKLYWLFSREAVDDGSLEKRAKELPKPRGKAVQRGLFPGGYQSIDESFLAELDEYRTTLARTFKNRNPKVDSETLTELTQRTLDRLVFLRFLEDKGIEPERLVEQFGERGTAWEDFIAASRRLDGIYNGIVYRRHDILDSAKFHVDEDVFGGICESLAHINSPYDFNAIPIHILGSIYERFLGKVIVATDKRVRVEEKPEVRRAGGVYYTPEYIVRYIVENTVGKLIAGKKPDQIAEMRFADIACGSGSFLLGVFDLLLRYHGHYYNENPGKARKGDCIERDGKLFLTLHKKREILLNNIYGVDIDPQAVEVCQLSLYLKLLQEETEASARQYLLDFEKQALLPSLSKNIVCGNSLIGTDILEGQLFAGNEERKLNPMNFEDAFPEVMERGGFDAVVGNPPYVRQESLGALFKDYAQEHFATYTSMADLCTYFIERAHKVLRDGGFFGYIVSNKFMRANYGRTLRDLLSSKTTLLQIIDFGELPVFANAATFPAVLVTRNTPAKKQKFVHAAVKRLDFKSLADEISAISRELDESALAGDNWTLADPATQAILSKIKSRGIPLGDYLATKIRFGVKTGLTEAFVLNGSTARAILKKNPQARPLIKPFVLGDDIRHYMIQNRDRFLICIPNGWTRQQAGRNAGWDWFARKFPALAEHLAQFAEKAKRRCDRGEYWWELRPCDYYDAFETPKIIYPDIAKDSRFTLDEEGFYSANTTYVTPLADKYLLAILNSKLMFAYYKSIAAVLGDPDKGGRLRWFTQDVVKLPIRKLDLTDKSDKARYDEIVAKVDAMLAAKKELAKAKTDKNKTYYENKCVVLDRQIDQLVYKLYGLTEQEIKVIESTT